MQEPSSLRPSVPSGRNTRVVQVDLDTGELLDGVSVLVRPKRRYVNEGYLLMFQTALTSIASDNDLGTQEYRVLMHLLGTLGMANEWRIVNLTDLGKTLGMKQQNVSASMKKLVEKSIVIKGARIGRGHAYSLNPYFGWKGAIAELQGARHSASPLHLLPGGKKEEPGSEKIMADLGAPSLFPNDIIDVGWAVDLERDLVE